MDLELMCSTPCVQRWLVLGERITAGHVHDLCPSQGRTQNRSRGLCIQPLVPSIPGSWRAHMQPGWFRPWGFGTPLSTASLQRKKRRASHLSHEVSHSQQPHGTRLLPHDTSQVQQRDTGTERLVQSSRGWSTPSHRLRAEQCWHTICRALHPPVLPVPSASKPLVS